MAYDMEKERREAMDAGYRALESLKEAQKDLNSAKNWGIWDVFGGGSLSSFVKHSKMEQAKVHMERARSDLKNFGKELNDVNMGCNLDIETGDFLSFADLFFDGFVVDWLAQNRINQAARQVEEAIRRVKGALDRMQGR